MLRDGLRPSPPTPAALALWRSAPATAIVGVLLLAALEVSVLVAALGAVTVSLSAGLAAVAIGRLLALGPWVAGSLLGCVPLLIAAALAAR